LEKYVLIVHTERTYFKIGSTEAFFLSYSQVDGNQIFTPIYFKFNGEWKLADLVVTNGHMFKSTRAEGSKELDDWVEDRFMKNGSTPAYLCDTVEWYLKKGVPYRSIVEELNVPMPDIRHIRTTRVWWHDAKIVLGINRHDLVSMLEQDLPWSLIAYFFKVSEDDLYSYLEEMLPQYTGLWHLVRNAAKRLFHKCRHVNLFAPRVQNTYMMEFR
jgi:hypothetical protein